MVLLVRVQSHSTIITMFVILGLLLTYHSVCVQSHGESGQLYSSLTHMIDLFVFDNVVGELLPLLPSHLRELTRYKESYSCLVQDTLRLAGGDLLNVAITGNPLHLFSVIKRLVLYWPHIKQSIAVIRDADHTCKDAYDSCAFWAQQSECGNNPTFMLVNCQSSCGLCGRKDLKERLAELLDLESRTVLPSRNDLRGASLALARLQQVYRLRIPFLADGKIENVSTCVRLNVFDCLRIANESHHEREYANAWLWYNYALATAIDPDLKDHIASLVALVADEHDEEYEDPEDPDDDEDDDEDDDDDKETTKFFPELLSDEPHQTPGDTKYSQLCRGYQRSRSASVSTNLKCYVSARGSPYLILQPVKFERLHNELEIYLFYDVISDNEIKAVQDTAKLSLERSKVVNNEDPVEIRVSQTAWLTNDTHPYLPGIAKRISAITGLYVYEGEMENMAGESIQVLSYGIGGHYIYHMDCFWKDYPEDEWESYEETQQDYESGDRMATWMFYLSDVQSGGRTAFPNAGISVTPIKGAAVFWYSIKKNGYGTSLAQHGGCPVLLGHKWVANKWIRENKNFLRRPCSIDPDE